MSEVTLEFRPVSSLWTWTTLNFGFLSARSTSSFGASLHLSSVLFFSLCDGTQLMVMLLIS